ncbi:MAG: hypothetical protein ACREO0_16150 [Pseudoxanthomonas sp.]
MKRLLVATLAAISLMGLLEFLLSMALGSRGGMPSQTGGYLDPLNLLVTAIAMCLGGYLEGKRFIAVALAISVVLWIATTFTLVQIAKPVQAHPLPDILIYNRVQIVFSLLSACAGAAIGAWLRMKRATTRSA